MGVHGVPQTTHGSHSTKPGLSRSPGQVCSKQCHMNSWSDLEKDWHFLDRGFLGLRAGGHGQVEWVITSVQGPIPGSWKGRKGQALKRPSQGMCWL